MSSIEHELFKEIEEGLCALTVRNVPTLRAFRRTISRQIAKWAPQDVLSLAERMVGTADETLRYLAYELLEAHKPARGSLDAADLERLGQSLDSWDSVDTFAMYLSGPAWRDAQISIDTVVAWASRDSVWWRRTALVSTVVPSRRGQRDDSEFTIQICELLVDDREDMVVKALSWALRELVKNDRAAVEAFLIRFQGRVPARARREVRNKLETGLKGPRRKISG